MAVNIGPRIGIEGENEYRSELMKIIETQKTLNAEMKATQSAWDETTTAEKKAKDTAEALNQKIKTQRERVEMLQQAVKESSDKFGENSTKTLKWRQALADATTELNRLENELRGVPTKAELLGKKFEEAGQRMQKAGQKIQTAGNALSSVGTTLSTYVTTPILAAGAAAVKFASDYEENLNKVDASFKDSSGVVKDWAKTATQNFGMSESAALDATSTFGDMGTSMGLSNDEAAQMSISLAGLAGDLSSFKNIDIQTAMTALKGVFTGETESLKGLGVVMTETNLKAFAEDMGLVYDEMTQAEKVTLRYKYVMKNTANAQGDYVRTADGFANSVRTLKAETSNLASAFGEELLPYLTPLVQKATDLVKGFGDLTETEKKTIIKTAGLAAAAGPLLTIGGKLVTSVGKMVEKGGMLVEWIGKVVAGQTAISSTALAAGAGIGALAGFAIIAYKGYKDLEQSVRDANTELYNSIDSVNATNGALETTGQNLKKGFDDAAEAIADVETNAKTASKIAEEIEELTKKTSLTADEQARLKVLVAEMNELYPNMGLAIDDVTGKLNMSNAEIKKFIENEYNMAKAAAYSQAVKTALTNLADAELAVAKAQIEREQLESKLADTQAEYDAIVQKNTDSIDNLTGADRELAEMSTQVEGATHSQKMAINDATDALNENQAAIDANQQAQEEAQRDLELSQAALEQLAESMGMTVDELLNMNSATDEAGEGLDELADETGDAAEEIDEHTKEIRDAYWQTYQSAKENIMSQTDIWKELEEQEKTSIEKMRKNLGDHISAYRNWNTNASKLMSSTEYQTDKNFRAMVDHVVSAGMDLAPELDAIVQAYESGDSELAALTADYGDLDQLSGYMAQTTANAETSLKYGLEGSKRALNQSGVPAAAKKMMSDTSDAISNYDLGNAATKAVKTVEKAKPEAGKQGEELVKEVVKGVDKQKYTLDEKMFSIGLSGAKKMGNGITSAIGSVTSDAQTFANSVADRFASRVGDTYGWGKQMVENFASGIKKAQETAFAVAQSVANAVASMFRHSVPKTGPFAHDDLWGYHMIQNFANGMERGIPDVRSVAEEVAMAAALPARTYMDIDAVSGRSEMLTTDDIYTAFSMAIAEQDTRIVIGNREFGRILREQGVA